MRPNSVRLYGDFGKQSNTTDIYAETLVGQKLFHLYSGVNKAVLIGLIAPLAKIGAHNKTDELFKIAVKRQLLICVRRMYPSSEYPEGTAFELLVIAATRFYQERDRKIGF